jgi:acylphosphatase
MMDMSQAHVWISGKVQGVFFRHHTRVEAVNRGLRGWVRNLPDSRVEAVFQGDKGSVEGMIQWCHAGPELATVKDVYSIWEQADQEFQDFEIRHF